MWVKIQFGQIYFDLFVNCYQYFSNNIGTPHYWHLIFPKNKPEYRYRPSIVSFCAHNIYTKKIIQNFFSIAFVGMYKEKHNEKLFGKRQQQK